MALEGNLSDFGIADLFQLIGLGQRTGCLEIKGRSGNGEIYFENGFIVHARANTLEAENAVYDMFNWSEGKFIFIPDKKSAKSSIMWDWQNLILEAARRSDELIEARKGMPEENAVLAIVDAEDKSLDNIHLNNDDLKLLSLVNGIRTVKEIITKSNMDPSAAMKIMATMTNAKILETIVSGASNASHATINNGEVDRSILNYFVKRKKKFLVPNTAVGLIAEMMNRYIESLFMDNPPVIINMKMIEEKFVELKMIYPVMQDIDFSYESTRFDADAVDWVEAGSNDASVIVKGLVEILEHLFDNAREVNPEQALIRYRDVYQSIAKDSTKMEIPSEAVVGLKNVPKK